MEQSKAMECASRKASSDGLKPRNIYIYIYIYIILKIYCIEIFKVDRKRIDATEMDALRRSARISKLDRKTNKYIREKMNAQHTILDEITRKKLIW
jgi:hypothetical protein